MKSTESRTIRITQSVEKILYSYIKKGNEASILLAYSAGPDSTVLLDVLSRLKKNNNIRLAAAYYNHCLRKKSEIAEEIDIAKKNCESRDVELYLGCDSEGLIGEMSSELGTEAAARKARYAFLNDIAEKNSFSLIAVAHNQDDNYETIIMRFFTGSGPEGLKGISEKSSNIIRPLLRVKKMDVMEYLDENKIPYSFDSTNGSKNYLRNRVRNELIPCLRSIYPGFEKSISELAEKMSLADQFMTDETERRLKWEQQGNYLVTDFTAFKNLPLYLRIKAVYNAFDSTVDNDQRLPYSFIKPVARQEIILKSPLILNGCKCRLEKEGNLLFWKSDIVNKNKNSYLLHISPGKEYKLPVNGIHGKKGIYVSSEIVKISQCSDNDLWLPVNKASGIIYVRNRLPGDAILFRYGRKSIKKLFQELGITRDMRDLIPVVCDNSGIVAVWGSVFGFKNRVAERINYSDRNENKDVILFKTRQE